jgi:adhesin transport system membrane fusion protein
MSELDAVLTEYRTASWRGVAALIMLVLLAFIVWANVAHLDEVTIAEGEVVPQGQVKLIQHLEGGKADQPLVLLDLSVSEMNPEQVQVRLAGLALTRARLQAEIRGDELVFPDQEARRLPEVVKAERNTFEGRMRELASRQTSLREQVRQRELEVREAESRRTAVQNDLRLAKERLAISSNLLSSGLTPRIDHLQLEREADRLTSELATLKSTIPRTRAALAESRARLNEEELKFRREALEALGQVEIAIAQNAEHLERAEGQARRTEIKSPIDGVVKNLRYHTIGGVVRSGEPIMEIVPLWDKLVIEGKLNPVDRGYVEVGMDSVVKVSTYDFVRYGGLAGKVIHIAADSSADGDGRAYFRVIVETDRTYLGENPDSHPITAGMQATIEVHTGEKTVVEYLLKPVLKLKHEAFRER